MSCGIVSEVGDLVAKLVPHLGILMSRVEMVLHRSEKEVEEGVDAVDTDRELEVIPLDSVTLDIRRREALVETLEDTKDIPRRLGGFRADAKADPLNGDHVGLLKRRDADEELKQFRPKFEKR